MFWLEVAQDSFVGLGDQVRRSELTIVAGMCHPKLQLSFGWLLVSCT